MGGAGRIRAAPTRGGGGATRGTPGGAQQSAVQRVGGRRCRGGAGRSAVEWGGVANSAAAGRSRLGGARASRGSGRRRARSGLRGPALGLAGWHGRAVMWGSRGTRGKWWLDGGSGADVSGPIGRVRQREEEEARVRGGNDPGFWRGGCLFIHRAS